MQAAIYCGVPAANNAFHLAEEVFAQMDRACAAAGAPRRRCEDTHPGRHRRRRPCRAAARASAAPARGSSRSSSRAASRDYVEQRVRAGVLEQGTRRPAQRDGRRRADAARGPGASRHRAALRRRGPPHRLSELTGGARSRSTAQQEVVKDLIAARLAAGGEHPVRGRRTSRSRHRHRERRGSAFATMATDTSCAAISSPAATVSTAICRAGDPGRRADRFRARLPVRVARHPRRGRAHRTTS